MNQWNAALSSMMTAQSHYRCSIFAGGGGNKTRTREERHRLPILSLRRNQYPSQRMFQSWFVVSDLQSDTYYYHDL